MGESAGTVVEMLWEQDDPDDVLRARFGFEDAEAASRWVIRHVEAVWDVRVDACERIVMSAHNALAWLATTSGPLLLKWSIAPDRFPRLAATAELTAWVAQRGIPVSAPLPATDGRFQVEADGASLGLQRSIDGELLDVSDPDQVHAAGAALARLHRTLNDYPAAERIPGVTPPDSFAGRIAGWLESRPPQVSDAARERLQQLVADAGTSPIPMQLVHGDYRSANILFSGADIAAILDFEEVRMDHAIADAARSAVMLGTRYRAWGPVTDAVRSGFRAGYETVRAFSPAEAGWWDPLVLWWSLMLTPAGDDPTGWGAEATNQLA